MHELSRQSGTQIFAGEVARRAGAGRGERELLAGFLHRLEELGHARVMSLAGDRKRKRHDGRECDGLQVLRIVREPLDPVLIDRDLGGLPDQQCVAVRG